MSDRTVESIIQDELSKHPIEDRPIIFQMMNDKLTGKTTSKRDYKKLIKIQKKLRLQRIKNITVNHRNIEE